ncbi:MAG: AMP-binding protein, partial [Clostridiales bacterium]|nr:AMP-binding protein [Clostridiales bacterium]
MRIAFSTIGCPDFDWVDIYTMAKDFQFDGIEIRGIGRNIHAVTAAPFTPRRINQTIRKLSDLRLTIPCLSSSTPLKDEADREAAILEITEYIELAGRLGASYIRVLADREPQPEGEVDDEKIARALLLLADRAKGKGVKLLVETNGVYADTARLRKLLDRVNRPEVAALWDIHHPYRFFHEQPEATVQNLGRYIRHVHAKDSVVEDGRIVYKMMGEGDLPIYRMLDCLRESDYDGFVSLEWVKRWMPDLTDAGIVFPHFAHFVKTYSAQCLQTDNRGTGKYPWPKEHLIDLTFPEVLDRIVKEFPDQFAFRYTTCDYTRTYSEFRDDVDLFARSLIAMGVKRGDHVAIWATNIPQWFITFWAAVEIGAVLVTVNTAYKVHEAEYLLRQSDTHTLIMIDGYKDSNYVEIINEVCPELKSTAPGELFSKRLPYLRNVISCESEQPGCFTWEGALALAKDVPMSEVHQRARQLDRHDVCNMQYTSGTTGFPKGVMLTHYNVVNNGKAIGDCMDLSSYDQLMIQVPMFHCFGMVLAMTAAMTHATTMSPIPYFSPKVSLECIRKEPITAFHGVPTMFIAMLEHPDFEKTDFSRVRTGIMAGSPCPVKVMQEVFERMHMTEVCITYGQTEASPATTMSKTTDPIEVRVNTVGGPMFAVECKIVDPETGEELSDDVDGEFCARGYNIMKGYYKMPEAT